MDVHVERTRGADDQHAVDTHHVDIDKQVKIYITVFVALMALTLITVAVSYLHLPPAMAIAVALLVATVKGTLVACYFMHLIAEKKLIYAVLVHHGGVLRRAAGASGADAQQRLLDSRGSPAPAPAASGAH